MAIALAENFNTLPVVYEVFSMYLATQLLEQRFQHTVTKITFLFTGTVTIQKELSTSRSSYCFCQAISIQTTPLPINHAIQESFSALTSDLCRLKCTHANLNLHICLIASSVSDSSYASALSKSSPILNSEKWITERDLRLQGNPNSSEWNQLLLGSA